MANPKEVFWSIRHATERRRKITGLNYDQAAFVVSLIPSKTRSEWLAWHEGMAEWTTLNKIASIFDEASSNPPITAPVPPSRPKSAQVEDLAEFTMTTERIVDRRLNRRFLKEFRVEVLRPGAKSFLTKTVNVSSNGMLLKARVPEEFGRSFNCRVSREDGAVMMMYCQIVRDKDPKGGTRLKFLEVGEAKVLLAWLVDQKTR